MAHQRDRYLQGAVADALRWSRTVSIVGMRQVGKSTMIEKLAGTYLTFDDDRWIRRFEEGDWTAIERAEEPIAIDECQKFPPVFDRVKLIVDRLKRPGQFLLAGSVRFSSRRQIRESLTGRTAILELLPFTLSESHRMPLSEFVANAYRWSGSDLVRDAKNGIRFSTDQLLTFLERGGLPGISFKRDSAVRQELFETHLQTMLGRDIHLIYPTRFSFPKLKVMFSSLASQQGAKVNQSELSRKLNTSVPTIRCLLSAMEGLFLIRELNGAYFVEDPGLASAFIPPRTESALHWAKRLAFHEIRAQVSYDHRGRAELSSFRSRGGIDIPFLVKFRDGTQIAICVDDTEGASDKSQKSLTWFLRKRSNAKGVVLHLGKQAYLTSGGHPALPLAYAF
jgi:predicted AAA+ superfamily ATPase